MHDAGVVRVLEPVTDLAQVAPRGQRVQRAALHEIAQRSAADQRHGQVGDALGHLEVVDREDVRVVELGERLRLSLEPLDEALVLEQLRRQRFQRDLTSERLLHGSVHDRHAASAEAFDDLV